MACPQRMFEQYRSIETLVQGAGLERIKAELNASAPYVHAVKTMGFREIGLDYGSKDAVIGYSSFHDNTGRIRDIKPEHENPDILLQTREEVLIDILRDIGGIRSHPLRSFFAYAPCFHPQRTKDYVALTKLITRAPLILAHSFSAYYPKMDT